MNDLPAAFEMMHNQKIAQLHVKIQMYHPVLNVVLTLVSQQPIDWCYTKPNSHLGGRRVQPRGFEETSLMLSTQPGVHTPDSIFTVIYRVILHNLVGNPLVVFPVSSTCLWELFPPPIMCKFHFVLGCVRKWLQLR